MRRSSASESRLPFRTETEDPVVIVPIILAGDSGSVLGFPKALAQFGAKTALQIALDNCRGLAQPIVVVSHRLARRLVRGHRFASPSAPGARIVVHRRGSRGQLGSLLAGLRAIPAESAFMVYAVDYPLLTRVVVRRLVDAFECRPPHQSIALPRYGGRAGHPVIFAPELRGELARAESARAVIYRDPGRVRFVAVREPSITRDFDTPSAYRRVLREYLRQWGK